ncbi:MAG: DUF4465 domain-containing protein [Bacteroides sp.]|nr:DUF4465 domain-containing protein [Bacteroides sp.]
MKKLLFALVAVALMTACAENDEINSSVDYVVTGYNETELDTRTAFDTPKASTIPFLWTSGDYIWLGSTKSDAITSDCQIAQFAFSNGQPAIVGTGHVFYNMTFSSNNAYVLANQTADGNLGNDGDFGYSTLDAFGSFCLKHKTSYIWFDTTTDDDDMPKLTSITVDAGDVNIAGKQTYDYTNDEWSSDVIEGSSTITLNFAGGHTLVAENEGVMAAMVCLPAAISGKTLTITYTFEGGSIFTETKKPTKNLAVGATTRIKTEIAKDQLYELRVLTFEDDDAKFSEYTLDYAGATIKKWSDLIDNELYGGALIYGDYMSAEYTWWDEGNTELYHTFPYNYYAYCYWGGGHAISNFANKDYVTYGDYTNQLMVYGEEGEGGHNGSANFAMHFGYIDGSPVNLTEELSSLQFKDEEERIIDHMYINVSCYVLNCLVNGNSLTGKLTEVDSMYIIATGFDSEGNEIGDSTFYLAKDGEILVTEWTKWDLSELGAVAKVYFNVGGTNQNKDGFSQPAYFAYDDVAVRFEK